MTVEQITYKQPPLFPAPKDKWTRFYDMHSGGDQKTPYKVIFIQAPEKEAIDIFKERFDWHPLGVTCSCCGEDFSVTEEEEGLEEASARDRSRWPRRDDVPLDEYVKQEDVLVMETA